MLHISRLQRQPEQYSQTVPVPATAAKRDVLLIQYHMLVLVGVVEV